MDSRNIYNDIAQRTGGEEADEEPEDKLALEEADEENSYEEEKTLSNDVNYDDDKQCAVGEQGELCISGTGIALGYWNSPELSLIHI